MCEICGKSPCDPRCPNAREDKPVYICCECFTGIEVGEKYIESPKGSICKGCVDSMTATELMEIMGEKFSTAKKEE